MTLLHILVYLSQVYVREPEKELLNLVLFLWQDASYYASAAVTIAIE